MTEAWLDAAGDTLKLIPFLLVTYLIMEDLEHRAAGKTQKLLRRAGKAGPLLGAAAGLFPQCGFSAAAANFYSARLISRGLCWRCFYRLPMRCCRYFYRKPPVFP